MERFLKIRRTCTQGLLFFFFFPFLILNFNHIKTVWQEKNLLPIDVLSYFVRKTKGIGTWCFVTDIKQKRKLIFSFLLPLTYASVFYSFICFNIIRSQIIATQRLIPWMIVSHLFLNDDPIFYICFIWIQCQFQSSVYTQFKIHRILLQFV